MGIEPTDAAVPAIEEDGRCGAGIPYARSGHDAALGAHHVVAEKGLELLDALVVGRPIADA